MQLATRIRNPGALFALKCSPYIVVSTAQKIAPILGPMTKPRTAQVLNVAVISTFTDGNTAADR